MLIGRLFKGSEWILKVDELKEEALERLKILKLYKRVIPDFINQDKVNKFDFIDGTIHSLNLDERNIVRKFEFDNKALVFLVLKTENLGKVVYDLLYVNEDIEYWDIEKTDLRNGYATSYTLNDYPDSYLIKLRLEKGVVHKVSSL